MPREPVIYADDEIASIKELVGLYESVGWLTYVADPDALARAVDRSTYVVTARDEEGQLLGLARCLSDDVSIMYLQDILVHPESQRQGIGRYLAKVCLTKFDHVRQTVLLTDNEPSLREFYEHLGYTRIGDAKAGNLLAFVQIKDIDLNSP